MPDTQNMKKRKHIFAIDDKPVIISSLKSIIEGDEYKFSGITSGEAALRYLATHDAPDLILLDVEMPGMNGYEVIKRLKSDPATTDIPVIFLTAQTDGDNELEGLSLGAIDYINKSLPPVLLLKRIEIHLLVVSQKKELVNFNANLQKMVEEKTADIIELENAILKTMAELVEYRDDITGGHIERTQAYLSVMLAAMQKRGIYEKEVSTWDIAMVWRSAQLHDVGKIAIPDSILQKPGKLTGEEFAVIKTHTTIGKQIIEKVQENTKKQLFLEYAKEFAHTHHEKWAGDGYPEGLSGEQIPLLGRIMAIADVYDALVSERPYKKAFSHQEARDIINDGKGKHFDPVLVDLFNEVEGNFEEILLA